MKRRLIILSALVAVVVAALAWVLFSPVAVKEPLYKGKPLGYWFTDQAYDEENSKLGASPSVPHVAAVREVGTNAIPTLLKLLRAHDGRAVWLMRNILRKQNLHRFQFTAATDLNQRAIQGFYQIKDSATSAIPELIKICDAHISESSQTAAIRTLGFFGNDAKSAVPALLKLAQDPSPNVSAAAKSALQAIDPEAAQKAEEK